MPEPPAHSSWPARPMTVEGLIAIMVSRKPRFQTQSPHRLVTVFRKPRQAQHATLAGKVLGQLDQLS